MKKNWMQLGSLLLSVVLLALLIRQGQTMENLKQSLRNTEHRLFELENEIQGISDDVTRSIEEAANPILKWEIHPRGISQDHQRLVADVTMELKHWQEDTLIYLETEVGPDRHILAMQVDDVGFGSGTMQFPIREQFEVKLAAVITGNGESQRVDLGGWGDISMLLPLQSDGGCWDGPEYRDGVLSSRFSISMTGWDYQPPGEIHDPKFQIYRNGEPVQTLAAVIDPYSGSSNCVDYTVDTEGYRWSLECDEGDTIEIRFLCRDEYGLGYDFCFAVWTAEGETPENQTTAGVVSGLADLKLTWPE